MHTTTKIRIIESAIQLFNEHGLANVRLQQIADDAGISVGNLAYHFKNKEAIVLAVYESLFQEFAQILTHYLQQPSLADLEQQLDLYYTFFSKYRFYLIDLFEARRSCPQVVSQWQLFVSKMTLQIRKRLDYCTQRGLITPEPAPGAYDTLTNNIWMTIVFWVPQQVLRGLPLHRNQFKCAVWGQISPYFTPKGRDELNLILAAQHVG
ncbi:MAG: TetR/AcrR family transcriptional regulator [Saprospiraceae bacterium]|nr:TetR/AcrR family transcriptional regulator [Saprospiraceae bacterium]